MLALNLADPTLFGNDAGEDEDPRILSTYFVDQPSFATFSSAGTRLAIARARKGMGKSALLAKVAHALRSARPDGLYLSVRASDLTGLGEFTSTDPAVLVNQWQQVICALLNIEIGRRLGFAYSDTTMIMVENSELAGMKSRNIIGALVDRFKGRLGPIELQKLSAPNALWLTKNHERENGLSDAWLFVDDIDATFLNRPELCLKIATFFSACRKLLSDVSGLNIRVSVRTDVWTTIRRIDESLDKCEQYVTDIRWSATEAERILINKIYSYVCRVAPLSEEARFLTPEKNGHAIWNLVFAQKMGWGSRTVPMDQPINILSAGRPRWSAQLCRLAGQEASRNNRRVIVGGDIVIRMREFGVLRLDDLYREHSHQFALLQGLVESFAGGSTRYTTNDLLFSIQDRFLTRVIKEAGYPLLDGRTIRGPIDLGRFLFKVGFIYARDDESRGNLSFIRYEDRSDLLQNEVNLDDGLVWEVHPSYRNTLRMRGYSEESPRALHRSGRRPGRSR